MHASDEFVLMALSKPTNGFIDLVLTNEARMGDPHHPGKA